MNPTDPSWVTDVAFFGFSVLSVVTGWRVFRTDSMVRATFLLLGSFLNVGGILLLLNAPYLGVAMLFMMTVEMMVMAVFMVAFMMNPAGLNPMNMVHQQRIAIVAGIAVFAGGAVVALAGEFPAHPFPSDLRSTQSLGILLLGNAMLTFETAGVTLLAAIIGSVILSSRRSRYGDEAGDAGSLPPSLDPYTEVYPDGVLAQSGGGQMHGHDHGGSNHGSGDMHGHDHGGNDDADGGGHG